MLKEIRRKSFRHSLILTFILFAVVIILILSNLEGIRCLFSGYTDFTSLQVSEIKEGMYVEVELVQNFSYFATSTVTNSTTNIENATGYYYVIYTGASDDYESEYKMMGIYVSWLSSYEMNEMAKKTYNGYTSDPLVFYGKIYSMPDDIENRFVQFFEEMGFSDDEIDDMILPYYIDASEGNISEDGGLIFALAVGSEILLWAIIRLIKGLTGAYTKKLMKVIATTGLNAESIDSDYNSAEVIGNKGVKVGRYLTYYNLNSTVPRAILNSNISWVYPEVIQRKINHINAGKTYALRVRSETKEKTKNIAFSFANTEAVQAAIEVYMRKFPWIVAGYAPELADMYRNNREQFLNIRYNRYPKN